VKLIPTQLITARCRLVEADQAAFDLIANVFSENQETLKLLMARPSPERLAQGLVTRQSLPPNGEPDRLLPFLAFNKAQNEVLGIVSVYCGYPNEDTLYLGDLFIRPDWQGQRFGTEIVSALEQAAAKAGFREVRLAVGLKNWPALRFWMGMGYNRITSISGSRRFAPDAFANLELSKSLY
jgi:ribosomal protein S18 acetylase RimI-like enzyme